MQKHFFSYADLLFFFLSGSKAEKIQDVKYFFIGIAFPYSSEKGLRANRFISGTVCERAKRFCKSFYLVKKLSEFNLFFIKFKFFEIHYNF